MKITEQEFTVLQAIAQNEYNVCNYGTPSSWDDTVTYLWTFGDGNYLLIEGQEMPKRKALTEVLISLIEKGLIATNREDLYLASHHHQVWHTAKGFKAWKTESEKIYSDDDVLTLVYGFDLMPQYGGCSEVYYR